MSEDPCRVLARQTDVWKRYMTGLRDLITALSALEARTWTRLYAAKVVRYTGYAALGAAATLAGPGLAAGKTLLGKIIMTVGGIAGTGSVYGEAALDEYLNKGDVPKVQRMIEEAEREFMAADRKMRQYRREYRELGCEVKYGKAP